MTYETFGPFELERDGNELSKGASRNLWAKMKGTNLEALPGATGIYIFALKETNESTPLPWYVGRTCEQGFKSRFTQKHLHFIRVLNKSKSGNLLVFFIALRTNSGKSFRKATSTKAGIGSNRWLESALIAECFKLNPKLLNISGAKYLKSAIVPGYTEGHKSKLNAPASALGEMLTQIGNKQVER